MIAGANTVTIFLVGLLVGIAGGLIGLGGAELRLPYLVGVLGLTAHRAVPINLAVSLFTILAAVPTRLLALNAASLAPFLAETVAMAIGAVVAAWVGAGWLRAVSGLALRRLIFVLLVVLGVALLVEVGLSFESDGFLPSALLVRLAAGLFCGFVIGAISSILGVAGGEVIIPTLVFGYGIAVKTAGSLSMLISVPTVLTGIVRHARAGAFTDRMVMRDIVVPLGLASALGAVIGGVLAIYVAGGLIKAMLGALLIWSAWKVFAKDGRHAAVAPASTPSNKLRRRGNRLCGTGGQRQHQPRDQCGLRNICARAVRRAFRRPRRLFKQPACPTGQLGVSPHTPRDIFEPRLFLKSVG